MHRIQKEDENDKGKFRKNSKTREKKKNNLRQHNEKVKRHTKRSRGNVWQKAGSFALAGKK